VELSVTTRKCRVEKIGKRQLKIILTQGLNRQIRRMCEYFGYRVEKLVRVRVMNIELGDLPAGKYRDVTAQECEELMKLIEKSSNAPIIPAEQSQKGRQNKNGRKKTTDRNAGRTAE
jgi:23S rRNA pseudouridine2604 synthase